MIRIFEEFDPEFFSKVRRAKKFATKAHQGQKRFGEKHEDYIIHPENVARIVYRVKKSHKIADLIAAAYLHDVIEDTEINPEEILKEFGEVVYSLVKELTSDKEQIKLKGKENYLIDKMLHMSNWGLVLKLADRLNNLKDVKEYLKSSDPKLVKWAQKYSLQTQNIIKEIENKRDLSAPQKKLIQKIKDILK